MNVSITGIISNYDILECIRESLPSINTLSQSSLKEISLTRCALCANDCNTPSRDVRSAIIVKSRMEARERAKSSRFGKKLADEQRKRRRKKRYTQNGKRARKKFPLLWRRRRLQPYRPRLPLLPLPACNPRRLRLRRLVVVLVGFSPSKGISEREREGGGNRDARMCQNHSIDFSVSRGTHGESPVCRVRVSPAALNAPPKTASRIRSSPGFLFKVNPLNLARHLRVKQTSVGRSIKTTEVTFARLVPCCSDCALQLCE